MEKTEAETFQQQALEIRRPDSSFDPTMEPQTGEEFLMKMMHERNYCPSVVVKRPKTRKGAAPVTVTLPDVCDDKMKDISVVSPSRLRPTIEWKDAQAEDFIATRDKINDLREQLKLHNYTTTNEMPLTDEESDWNVFCRANPPLLSIILRINQRSLEKLLEFQSEWLRDVGEESIDEEPQEQPKEAGIVESMEATPSSACAATTITTAAIDLSGKDEWLGSWIYSTLACLRLPLEPDVHSVLRDIARSCIRLRNKLSDDDITKAVPYNLFVYIICKVFGQLDLAQFV